MSKTLIWVYQVRSSLRTGGEGYEELEEGTLGVSVADRGRDGREPFLWVAIELVLNNLVVMQRYSNDKCADESSCMRLQG